MKPDLVRMRRDRACSELMSTYGTFGPMHGLHATELHNRYMRLMQRDEIARLPRYAKSYIDGYRRALDDNLYRDHLWYGVLVDPDGARTFYTTHDDPIYGYTQLGISEQEFSQITTAPGNEVGHWWKALCKRGTFKPFWTHTNITNGG